METPVRYALAFFIIACHGCDGTTQQGTSPVDEDFVAAVALTRDADHQTANKILDEGVRLAEKGQNDEALARWQVVVSEFKRTSAWAKAAFNSGRLLYRLQKHDRAIEILQLLLSAEVDNKEPTGFIDAPYVNYKYWACIYIAESYESLGDIGLALNYSRLARDEFPYETWCGTCAESAEKELREYIEALSSSAKSSDTSGMESHTRGRED